MRRLILPALLIVVMGLLGWLLASNPGSASADWLGWRVDTSAALVAVLVFLVALAAAAIWTAVLWLLGMPARGERRRAVSKQGEVQDVLTKGWLALAAGDGPEARRLAAQARGLDDGIAARLLAAQAAEAADDDAAAQSAYAALLEIPEARAAARAGLSRLEQRRPPIAVEAPAAEPEPPPFPATPPVTPEPLTLIR